MQHKISNMYIQASIKELGAELCSLNKANSDIEFIWQADKNYWARHSPILFPIVGKLLDDEYIYEDKIYSMSQHGFARDSLFKVFEQSEDFIVFRLESSADTLKVYPFEFILDIGYRLEKNTLIISWRVENKSKSKMLFSIGAHPAFNWPLNDSQKEDYFLEFEDTKELERLPLTSDGISNEKDIITLDENKLLLNEKLFSDDAIVIENLKNKKLSLKNRNDDLKVEVEFENFPYLGIWSKPNGAPFICIEPWQGVADFIEHNKVLKGKKGIISLEKDGEFKTSYKISI